MLTMSPALDYLIHTSVYSRYVTIILANNIKYSDVCVANHLRLLTDINDINDITRTTYI